MQDIKIDISEKVKDKILKNGIDTNYGARPLKRAIQNILEDKIAEEILEGKIQRGKTAKIILDEQNNIIVE